MRLATFLTPLRLGATVTAAAVACGLALAAWGADEVLPPAADRAPMHHPHGGPMPAGGFMLPRGPMLDHLLDRIDVTTEQRAQVHRLVDAAQAGQQTRMAAARADHAQLMQLFMQPTVDAAAVEAVRQRLVARADETTRADLQSMVELSRILTVEQRQRLHEQMKALHARHAGAQDGNPAAGADGLPPPASR